jgi:hypothetical protein
MNLPALTERCHTGLSPIIVWLLLPAVVLNEELILNKSHHVGGRGFVHHLVYGMDRSTIRGGDEDENHSVEITCSDNLDDKTRYSLIILYDLSWVPCNLV